jgi:hypothetical protein
MLTSVITYSSEQLKQVGDGDASGSGKRAKLRNSIRVKRDTFRDRRLGFVVVRTKNYLAEADNISGDA